MTILQIAGTSGSGKSHLMRAFLKWAEEEEGAILFKEYMEDRSSPIGYRLTLKGRKAVYVSGAYDVPTGGCDTIRNVSEVFSLIRDKHESGHSVLFEGLFCMNQTRGPRVAAELGKAFVVLQLTTPLATCLSSINTRRAERGEEALETKKNTIDNYKRAENYCYRMRDAGARVIKVDRDRALRKILELLGGEK